MFCCVLESNFVLNLQLYNGGKEGMIAFHESIGSSNMCLLSFQFYGTYYTSIYMCFRQKKKSHKYIDLIANVFWENWKSSFSWVAGRERVL